MEHKYVRFRNESSSKNGASYPIVVILESRTQTVKTFGLNVGPQAAGITFTLADYEDCLMKNLQDREFHHLRWSYNLGITTYKHYLLGIRSQDGNIQIFARGRITPRGIYTIINEDIPDAYLPTNM